MPTAHVREAAGIPGTIGAHRVPLPRQAGDEGGAARRRRPVRAVDRRRRRRRGRARSPSDVGFPLIVKPRDGAGASGTNRVDNAARARATRSRAAASTSGRSVAVEEFIEGHEGFYDTLTIDGQVVHDFVSPLLPERARGDAHALDLAAVRRDEPHRHRAGLRRGQGDGPEGRSTLLGIETSATHMEWFFGPKGLKFSEIGCRPPGVRAWDLYNVGNDIDLYREWAMAVVHGRPSQRPSRRFAAGHHRAAPRPRRPHRRLRGPRRDRRGVRRLHHRHAPAARRARRRSRSRPATWRTPGCA